MLKSVALGALAVGGFAFGIGVFVTDHGANIAAAGDAIASAVKYAPQRSGVSTIDPNDSPYRRCLADTENRQQAAKRAEDDKWVADAVRQGVTNNQLRMMWSMTRFPSPDEIARAQQANFMRIKEYCRLNFACADGSQVSADYNTCYRRVD
jgi:hypothetical protein